MEKSGISLINFVPCKLAEPISAISINRQLMVFGSMSGYIGFLILGENEKSEATYIEEVFDQSIRSVISNFYA